MSDRPVDEPFEPVEPIDDPPDRNSGHLTPERPEPEDLPLGASPEELPLDGP